MKRFLNLILLGALFVLTAGVMYQRLRGAYPTQFSDAFIYIILILNVIWIFWNVQKDSVLRAPTKMERN
jgi:hypothetical protein